VGQRPLVKQEGDAFAFAVPVAPAAPLAPQLGLGSMIDSFMITVPAGAANSIFLGFNAGVIVGNGIELLVGTTVNFRIDHDGRQLYEIQNLLTHINNAVCGAPILPYEEIPLVCWDMSQIYVVAAAATNITFATFKTVYA